ncbi:MAG: BREX-4 system phosphatase PglZ [Paludibacteraceae bacterium]|nr:BREX-4 system phosphatase PglZ [Paludibacteraceae bacterium]
MYRSFNNIEELEEYLDWDKQANGYDATTRDRYPIRFVLFDNFRDCYDFVNYLQSKAHVESVENWIDQRYPDIIITPVELAERIADHIKGKSPHDCVIAPFSELARFYENSSKKSFDALIKTIKAIQANPDALENHQRVYIPIVGLEGKMETFTNDSQITIWRLLTTEKDLTYRLILTDKEDYGVKGLENSYTIVNNIREWLNIWRDIDKQVTPHIICKSRAIYANALNAQPDNAFSYEVCDNAYDFLTKGLNLSFGSLLPQKNDDDNWEELAKDIDISDGFSFTKYVLSHFGVIEINDYKTFINLWFSHRAKHDRWLLARYYSAIKEDYITKILSQTENYGTSEFIENLACDFPENDEYIGIRKYCLSYAAEHHVILCEAVESHVSKSLDELPSKIGYTSTLKYFTGISKKELEKAVYWIGQRHISVDDIAGFYPDLYYYLKEGISLSNGVPEWVDDYIREYKKSKISNECSAEIKSKINIINGSESAFYKWYNQFSTTYTILSSRKDIEKIYWIDGLGIDWIPLVKQIISERCDQKIYLNEIKIACAKLPTKTSVNKDDLKRLLPSDEQLDKTGDLDSLAHRTDNISPFTIIKEIEQVRSSIENILQYYNGKKLAIVSDHGMTYLSQYEQGKNIGGVDSDHHGRIAIRKKTDNAIDESYLRLEDNKTLCALKHESLCGKVPSGQGVHGGCTPEEVLVPIFIISNSSETINWVAHIRTLEVSGTSPRVQFEIKNIPATDIPYIEYDKSRYEVHCLSGDIYETDDLILNSACESVILHIGTKSEAFKIKVSTGIEENDLFD